MEKTEKYGLAYEILVNYFARDPNIFNGGKFTEEAKEEMIDKMTEELGISTSKAEKFSDDFYQDVIEKRSEDSLELREGPGAFVPAVLRKRVGFPL